MLVRKKGQKQKRGEQRRISQMSFQTAFPVRTDRLPRVVTAALHKPQSLSLHACRAGIHRNCRVSLIAKYMWGREEATFLGRGLGQKLDNGSILQKIHKNNNS